MTLISAETRGVYAIAPTPFVAGGPVDRDSVDRMVDFYRATGVDGLTILGIMGEAQKLTPDEASELVRRIIARFGGPVVVGVSAPGFAAMRAISAEAMDAGAAGVMIAPPGGLRTDDQIAGYYRQAVAQIGADVPFVLQDHWQATGVVMSNAVVRRIIMENPSCVMLKHEDWPGLEKITALRDWQAEGALRPVSILCGNGGLFLDLEMARGADGAMTGYGFPEMLRVVVDAFAEGREAEGHAAFEAHLPLLRYEHQPVIGLAVRKHVLRRRGVLTDDSLRAPGAALTAQARAEVDAILDRMGVPLTW